MQLFQNLVGNALKFRGDDPPRVHIGESGRRRRTCGSSPAATTASASSEQYADKIFVIFQRLHGRDAYGGTGIGLAMCKKIVEYHGGRLWLDTEPRDTPGAVFRWTLPERQAEHRAGLRRSRDRSTDETRGRRMTQFEAERQIEVLLVEDDPGDVLMTREAFEDYKLHNQLHVVNDGAEAMAFLRQEGEYADRPRPDLVLLDLNLPRMDGREVLEAIKSDPELASIPVVVLTTSEAEEDVLRSYSLHANAYVTKPVDFERFIEVVRQIDDFFVTVVRLPRR